MFTILHQNRLRRFMKEGGIVKDILYGELIAGKRNLGRPRLRDIVRVGHERAEY